MKSIGNFLSRYLGLRPAGEAHANAVAGAIAQILGEKLPEGSIYVRGSVAYLSAPSVVKNEVALRKKEILAAVLKNTGLAPSDIR